MLSPSGLPVCLLFAAFLILHLSREYVVRGKAILAVSIGLTAACAPWVVRNTILLGSPVLFRSNLGLELALANHPSVRPTFSESRLEGSVSRIHPNFSLSEAEALRSVGEIEFNRRRMHDAINWITGHPLAFVRLSFARVREFWFPTPRYSPKPYAYVVWVLTVLSMCGAYKILRELPRVFLVTGAVLLVYPLIYYVVMSTLRYRMPILWVELLCAGYVLSFWLPADRNGASS